MYIVTGIVLVRQDLRQVLEAILLARATLRTIRQNLVWAFLYNLTLIPRATGGVMPCRTGHAAPAPLLPRRTVCPIPAGDGRKPGDPGKPPGRFEWEPCLAACRGIC